MYDQAQLVRVPQCIGIGASVLACVGVKAQFASDDSDCQRSLVTGD